MNQRVHIIQVRVGHRWWLMPYLRSVAFACWLTGTEPNIDRVAYWIKRGTYAEQVRV